MRRVYLVRHGHPDIPLGERWCLGRTDLPLAAIGRMQAALLPFDPELTGKPVFSSYLMRAIETAQPLCPEPRIMPGLEEQDLGEWDGLPFSEIMVRWPEL
ncbi:MAG: histidine phosphatase family protein, partial [Oscillospiraceae bacterium]|nr:histidine phosphatase family protein [Oscillospiraceae bacterium]